MRAGVSAYTVTGASPELVRSLVEVAVAQFRAHGHLQSELARSQQALDEGQVINRAKCLLMEQHGMSERDAYARLRRLAMDRRQSLVDISQSLMNQAFS